MKFLLRLIVLTILIAAVYITYHYQIKTGWGLILWASGIIVGPIFYDGVWDPIFGNSTIWEWLAQPFAKRFYPKRLLDI